MNYNASDDEDEYTLKSLIPFMKDLHQKGQNESGEDADDDVSTDVSMEGTPRPLYVNCVLIFSLDETMVKMRQEEDDQYLRDTFQDRLRIWFPRHRDAYDNACDAESLDDEEEEEEEEEKEAHKAVQKGKKMAIEESHLRKLVDNAYVECNAMANHLGEQGMHGLLLNSDYQHGFDSFATFINNCFSINFGHRVEFFTGKQTNYFDLTYDHNFDSMSMKKMGYFALGPLGDEQDYQVPPFATWQKTLRNSGFTHVTVKPVDFTIHPMSDVPKKVEEMTSKSDQICCTDEMVWCYDESFANIHTDGRIKSVSPTNDQGSEHISVYIGDTPEKPHPLRYCRRDGSSAVSLYRFIVNFVGMPKSPAWWNTASKWEIADMKLNQHMSRLENSLSHKGAYFEALKGIELETKSANGSATSSTSKAKGAPLRQTIISPAAPPPPSSPIDITKTATKPMIATITAVVQKKTVVSLPPHKPAEVIKKSAVEKRIDDLCSLFDKLPNKPINPPSNMIRTIIHDIGVFKHFFTHCVGPNMKWIEIQIRSVTIPSQTATTQDVCAISGQRLADKKAYVVYLLENSKQLPSHKTARDDKTLGVMPLLNDNSENLKTVVELLKVLHNFSKVFASSNDDNNNNNKQAPPTMDEKMDSRISSSIQKFTKLFVK